MYDNSGLAKMLSITLLCTLVGILGMMLTEIYCFVPLIAIGLCLSLMFGVWLMMGIILGGQDG